MKVAIKLIAIFFGALLIALFWAWFGDQLGWPAWITLPLAVATALVLIPWGKKNA